MALRGHNRFMGLKKTRDRIDNSLTELTLGLKAYATGGSQLSGLGTLAYSNNYGLLTQQRIMLTYMYSGNGIFQTAIHVPIQDALGKGIVIESGELTPEDIDSILDWMEEKLAWGAIEQGYAWSRLYGGGGVIINTPDEKTDKPLRLKENTPIEFLDFDRWMINGNPDDEVVTLNGVKIHRSRIIFMKGKPAPNHIRQQLQGWGMSEGERMIRDLNNYLKTGDVLYEILDESKIDIYKIKDFANRLMTKGGTSSIQKRIQLANEIKSYVNALVLDAEESFEQKTLAFSGLAEVMRENRINVASAIRFPMTKLFGLSASGFSTGEEDQDNYNDMVESDVRRPLRPAIRQMIEWACLDLFGYIPSFRFKWPPLKVVKEGEAETIKASATSRIIQLYDRGLIGPADVAKELKGSDVIAADTKIIDNPIPPTPAGTPENEPAPGQENPISVYRNGKQNAIFEKWIKKNG